MTAEYQTKVISLTLSGLLLALSACTAPTKPTFSDSSQSVDTPREKSKSTTLYDQLGGQPGVEELTEQFIVQIAADESLRLRYAKSDIGRFHKMMQEHMCEVTDGPCRYTGDNMKRTHGGMNIRSSEFNALVEALMRAMDNVQIPISTQNQLLARLAVFQPDVVGQ